MYQASTTSTHGGAAAPVGARPLSAKEAAQRCHADPSASNMVRFGTAMMADAMNEEDLDVKRGNLALRSGNLTIRSAEFRMRHGESLAAAENDAEWQRVRLEALRVREAQLMAELEALRESRGA